MASTMTCGEAKNTTFTKNDSASGDNSSFEKLPQKSAEKHFKANENNKVYQVRPGARIVKLNSKKDYNSFKQELSDRMNIPIDQINSIEDILRAPNSIYDGIMIGPKLQGSGEEQLLKDGGLKIFNENALAEWGRNTVDGNVEISKDEVFESMRSGFKAGGTEISDNARKLSEELYNKIDEYKNAVDSNSFDKYNISTAEGKERYDNFNKNGRMIEISIEKLSDENFDKVIMISDENTSKATSEAVHLSVPEVLRVSDACNSLNNNNIDTTTVASALTMYQHYNNSISNYNQVTAINKLETFLKDASNYGHLLAVKPNENSIVMRKLMSNVTSENMHREKLIWDKVIQSVKPEHRDQFNEIAKVCMVNSMNTHINIKRSLAESINFGDKKVNFADRNKKESITPESRTSKISEFRRKIFSNIEKQSLRHVRKAIKSLEKIKGELEKLDKQSEK